MNQLAPLPSPAFALPALIAAADDRAKRRFLELFAVTIRNPHTRRAYARATGEFLNWTRGNVRLVHPGGERDPPDELSHELVRRDMLGRPARLEATLDHGLKVEAPEAVLTPPLGDYPGVDASEHRAREKGWSNTMGAVIRSWRSAAMKVRVRQRPCGTLATSRSPRRLLPCVRVMFVFAQVSSMKTRRRGSSPC